MRLIDADALMPNAEYKGRYDVVTAYDIANAPTIEPEQNIIRCKDCKYFHYDKPYVVYDIPVLGHEVCDKWGDGCKTSDDGFCFLAERRGEEDEN